MVEREWLEIINVDLHLYDIVCIKKKRASRFSESCTVVNFVSINVLFKKW